VFSVIFEVQPRPDQWDAYLGRAKALRPELEKVEGFVDNIRYRSLTREGWLLSLSGWRDEKALVRWRTHAAHHAAQEMGRSAILRDYHLRIGEVTKDSGLPEGQALHHQRLDETQIGAATTITVIDARRPVGWVETTSAERAAEWMGLQEEAHGLVAWDVFDAVLTPGNVILLLSWRDRTSAEMFEGRMLLREGARLRRVRVIRDYGMFDRREAPQYYPEVKKDG
jgi:heme-degrading monooxygenase HmoA